MNKRVGLFRAIVLICEAGFRRWKNRIGHRFSDFTLSFKKKKKKESKFRLPTPVKKTGSALLLTVALLGYIILVVQMTSRMMASVSADLQLSDPQYAGRIPVSEENYRQLERIIRLRDKAEEAGKPRWKTPRDLIKYTDTMVDSLINSIALERGFYTRKRTELMDYEKYIPRIRKVFDEQGISGFYVKERSLPLPVPNRDYWVSGPQELLLIKVISMVLTGLLIIYLFSILAGDSSSLGKEGWDLQWLFTFPVPSGAVFTAKVLESAVTNLFTWVILPPFLFVIYWCRGFGWYSFLPAFYSAFLTGIALSGFKVFAETFLKKRFRPDRLRNMQGMFTIFSLILTFGFMGIVFSDSTEILLRGARLLPDWFIYTPGGLAFLVCRESFGIPVWLFISFVYALLIGMAFTWGAVLSVRNGLVKGGGGEERVRRKKEGRIILRGIVGKDIRLFMKDRKFLVQTLLTPIAALAYILFVNRFLIGKIPNLTPQVTGMISFIIGGYILASGPFLILKAEQDSLWLLYTFPGRLERLFMKKTFPWLILSPAICLASMIFLTAYTGFSIEIIPIGVSVIAGIIVYAYIATGLGFLGTDIFQQNPAKKVNPGFVFFYLFLMGCYGSVILSGSGWLYLVGLVFSVLFAYAVWQKVRDSIPYLLDPTEKAKPEIDITLGLFSVFSFFILQALVYVIGVTAEPDLYKITWIFTSYVISGICTAAGVLFYLKRNNVKNILLKTGIVPGNGAFTVSGSVKTGVAAGLAVGVCGVLWLILLNKVSFLRFYVEKNYDPAKADEPEFILYLFLLGVIAAPLLEEFIFRGLLFRGMRRTFSLKSSVFVSAGLFAAVHRPVSVVPVFLLGTVCAFMFHKSGRLLTAVMVHMSYNAAVLSFSLYLQNTL